ncbi:hypothetical protein F511_06248 [Dorcoceras hygrometricum]|uniref:Uncharacterized protein n=1 Tax=Dorcoceras hygrometricum TaxID=472368 RepID=A0A2Z7BAI7_9LAMI|nr:hypothetical protein F511_06248 [Dorcoceras hygrometricum]
MLVGFTTEEAEADTVADQGQKRVNRIFGGLNEGIWPKTEELTAYVDHTVAAVADVSFAAGSLARCVLYFGSWRQQRLRGFQQESAIEFRTAFTRVFGISSSVIVLSLRYGFELILRRDYGLEELLRGRAVIPHSHLPAGIVATMRRVVNYHSSWARQQQVELFDASVCFQFPLFSTMSAAALLVSSPPPPPYNRVVLAPTTPSSYSISLNSTMLRQFNSARLEFVSSRPDFRAWADDGDADGGGPGDYDMDEDEVEEVDNKKDFDVDYDTAAALAAGMGEHDRDDDIAMVDSKSFVYTQGWDSEKVVDYRINEDEFHKICLLDCDFFIRKPPDPDNDVYDFREMYVTPPDTDVYAIPKVLAPMPQKYIRCAQSDYGCYNVTEPPIDAPRDPMYKSEREVLKIFLTKHYRNRRLGDPEFALDFEEIYVIDSKTKSITRAKVVEERDDPTTVIEKEDWAKTREDMERHLRKLRDFSVSNWF